METIDNHRDLAASVNYEDLPIAEEHIDGTDYRIDAGLGSTVAISSRETGTWSWTLLGEGRWDGTRLRAKGLGHPVVAPLERALARAMGEREKGYE